MCENSSFIYLKLRTVSKVKKTHPFSIPTKRNSGNVDGQISILLTKKETEFLKKISLFLGYII